MRPLANGRPDLRQTLVGATALLLVPFFLWAGIFADGTWRIVWLAFGLGIGIAAAVEWRTGRAGKR